MDCDRATIQVKKSANVYAENSIQKIKDMDEPVNRLFVTINLPLTGNHDDAGHRLQELDHIYTTLGRPVNYRTYCVYRLSNFRYLTHDFLRTAGQNAGEVFIIINGHGCQEGLTFEENGTVAWETVVDIVNSAAEQRKTGKGLMLPGFVHLIIGACYGHMATKVVTKSFVKVKSLSSENSPTTTSLYTYRKSSILDVRHCGLEYWATQLNPAEGAIRSEQGEVSLHETSKSVRFRKRVKKLSLDIIKFIVSEDGGIHRFPHFARGE